MTIFFFVISSEARRQSQLRSASSEDEKSPAYIVLWTKPQYMKPGWLRRGGKSHQCMRFLTPLPSNVIM